MRQGARNEVAGNDAEVLAKVEPNAVTPYNERIQFRLFVMPCCSHNLCWVNPRLPTYCPECGENVYLRLRTGEHTMVTDDNAWLRISVKLP